VDFYVLFFLLTHIYLQAGNGIETY